MRRSRLSLVVAAAVCLAAAAPASAAPVAGAVDALYVVNASRGSFDGHTLALHGVSASVSWFADRPVRLSGSEVIADMHRQLFAAGQPQPNAALDIAGGGDEVFAVKLSRPAYDAKRRTLRYRARVLPSLARTGLVHLEGRRSAARPPRAFSAAALFVDDGAVAPSTPVSATASFPGSGSMPVVTDATARPTVLWASSSRPIVVALCVPYGGQCYVPGDFFGPLTQAQAKYTSASFYQYDPSAPENREQELLGQGSPEVPQVCVYENGVVVACRVGPGQFADFDAFLGGVLNPAPSGSPNPGR